MYELVAAKFQQGMGMIFWFDFHTLLPPTPNPPPICPHSHAPGFSLERVSHEFNNIEPLRRWLQVPMCTLSFPSIRAYGLPCMTVNPTLTPHPCLTLPP